MKVYLVIIALITCSSATLGPSKTKKGKQKISQDIKINDGPVYENVFERGLVTEDLLANRIVAEANTYFVDTSIKNFNGTVLGYVTPVSIKLIYLYA